MSVELHSNLFSTRSFLTLGRAVNFLHDNATKMRQLCSMSTKEDGPGPWPSVKFWYVDTKQTETKEVVDPTNKLKTVYVHGGLK